MAKQNNNGSAPKKKRVSKKKVTTKKTAAAKSKTTKKKKERKLVVIQKPIKRHVSPDLNAVFANHVMIRNEQTMFQLFFFDAQMPLVLDEDSEEVKKDAEERTHVDAHCVSRVAIPINIMPGLIKALQTNFDRQQEVATAMMEQGIKSIEDLK